MSSFASKLEDFCDVGVELVEGGVDDTVDIGFFPGRVI
jgi:hypothetical protein